MLQISYTTHIVHYEYILCSKMERMLCVNEFNWMTYFANSHLFEAALNEFEVMDVFVLKFGLEFDFLQWNT